MLPGFKHREENTFMQLMIFDVTASTANEYDSLADLTQFVLTLFGALHLAIMVRWLTE